MIRKTGFEWCQEASIKILGVESWEDSEQDSYMLSEITNEEFLNSLEGKRIETESKPIKPYRFLERRMYGLVPYNIMAEQIGIQFDHAAKDYGKKYFNDQEYQWYIREWNTDIILNGGTTNEGHMVRHGFKEEMYIGSMQKHLKSLMENNVKVGTFYEPDMNSGLSAIVFLVDERVFNKKLYPDFLTWLYDKHNGVLTTSTTNPPAPYEQLYPNDYKEWVEFVGGEQNVFLREMLGPMRLAKG